MNTKTIERYDCMSIKLIKRLLDENLVKAVLTDATYEDSFRLADSLNIEGDDVQYDVVKDFMTLNHDNDDIIRDEGGCGRYKKSKWISMVNSIDDLEKQVQNVIDYYRIIVDCYDEYDTDRCEHETENMILNDLYDDRIRWNYIPDRPHCYEIDIVLNKQTYKLLHWITEEMYTVTSTDIPRAEILDDGLHIDGMMYTNYSPLIHRRIIMEAVLYDRLDIGGTLTTKRSAAIEYLYGYHKRVKYILYALMGIEDLVVKNLSSIRIVYPEMPTDIMDSDTMVNREYTYTIYADRSDNSPDYAYERRITVPFSSEKHVYLIRHEPHSDDHIKMALELCILTGKTAAKILNTHDGIMYTVNSKLTTEHIDHYGRLLRANDAIIYSGCEWGIGHGESTSHTIVVSCIGSGSNIYEYAALVYDHKQHLMVDCIVLTNSRAKVEKYSTTVADDQKYSHGFVIEDVGEDETMTEQLIEFIGRYPGSPIAYYNVPDPDILYTDKREIIPLPYYMQIMDMPNLETLYDEMIQDGYYYDYDKDPIPLLFNRAFDDCIAVMKVGIHYSYQRKKHMNCDSCRSSDSSGSSDDSEAYGYDHCNDYADIWYDGDSMYR